MASDLGGIDQQQAYEPIDVGQPLGIEARPAPAPATEDEASFEPELAAIDPAVSQAAWAAHQSSPEALARYASTDIEVELPADVSAPAANAANAALDANAAPAPPSADDLLRSWRPGHYPDSAGLDAVRAGEAELTINQGGPAVRSLQTMLNQLGASPPLEVDGKLGPKSFAALREIQGRLGLEPTGRLDGPGLAALERAVAQGGAAPGGPAGTPGGTGPGAVAPPTAPGGAGPIPGGVDPAAGGDGPTGPAGPTGAGGASGLPFTPNEQALAAARANPMHAQIEARTERFAPIYHQAAEKTGVPASMIAAIHFNESHQGLARGPESGFGLDPRAIKTEYGNTILRQHGLPTPWERGGQSENATLQSAVIAAHTLKKNAEYLGFEVRPDMSQNEVAALITAYGSGAGSQSTKRALETGRSFAFDPSDPQPHVRHPGGSSIGADGQRIDVAPGVKEGLFRWDVLLPIMSEQLGGSGLSSGGAGPAAPTAPTTPGAPGAPAGPDGPTAPVAPAPFDPSAAAGGAPRLGLPPRAADAATGSAFIERTRGMNPAQREEAMVQEILSGNVPDLVRQLQPVQVSMQGPDGRTINATFFTMPDYLAVGSNDDFVRVPMSPLAAQRIADRLGMSLPTPQMVDAVYRQADVKLAPRPMTPGAQMMSSDYYLRHQQTIEGQREGQPDGALTAGHKKDVVLSNRLVQKPGSVAIYGWHQPNGQPIQGRSTVHENTYADYSHGARLAAGTMLVDGRPMAIADVMRDPVLSKLLSDEGPLQVTRQPGVPPR